MTKTEFVLRQSNENELSQIPEDVLESVKKDIGDRANKHEFRFNDCLSCDPSFYDAIKECLVSAKIFNPQTDELTISSPAKEPYHFDVKVVKPVYKFDFTIAPLEDKNE